MATVLVVLSAGLIIWSLLPANPEPVPIVDDVDSVRIVSIHVKASEKSRAMQDARDFDENAIAKYLGTCTMRLKKKKITEAVHTGIPQMEMIVDEVKDGNAQLLNISFGENCYAMYSNNSSDGVRLYEIEDGGQVLKHPKEMILANN